MKFRNRTAALITAVLAVALLRPAMATEDDPLHRVKGALLFNFAKFIDWSATGAADAETFRLCTAGEANLGTHFDVGVSSRTIRGKKVEVFRDAAPEILPTCQLLFIGASVDPKLTDIFPLVGASPTITVGETEAFKNAGGVIRFVVDGKKLRFDINVKIAKTLGVQISSELLKLARKVEL